MIKLSLNNRGTERIRLLLRNLNQISGFQTMLHGPQA